MNTPNYPVDFNECIRDKRLTEEQLNERISDELSHMMAFMKRSNTYNHSKSFEDVLIIIDRIQEDDDEYFEISIAKKHHRTRIKATEIL